MLIFPPVISARMGLIKKKVPFKSSEVHPQIAI
ncbi:Protein of unknown function [Pyronema omphalodes CBS 100304]|uniref:Uncharacterized protein n=1 Tax=Pyronema omphalodes (strain CBS 100304) TaxID=1076935 RepID=U4LKV4_PYROM|nr:Protein of unknown function [Pyronema omphalodes CBS 100304]